MSINLILLFQNPLKQFYSRSEPEPYKPTKKKNPDIITNNNSHNKMKAQKPNPSTPSPQNNPNPSTNPHIMAQNLKLLQALHTQIPFLTEFSYEQLNELVAKAYLFVFGAGTVIAQEKQAIDYIGVIVEGKVTVAGDVGKKSAGLFVGEFGYLGLLTHHAYSIYGDSDGIILAIKLQDLPKFSKQTRKIIHNYILNQCLESLKQHISPDPQAVQIQISKIMQTLPPILKQFLIQKLDNKEKQQLLKYFPFKKYMCKSKVVDRIEGPGLLVVVSGQLICKGGADLDSVRIAAGDFYNLEGFLLGYSTYTNIYCLSQQTIVLKINRQHFLNLFQLPLVNKIDNFLIRKQINHKKYEVLTSQRRRQKQLQQASKNQNKWSVFTKSSYQIIPLTIPKVQGNANQKAQDKSKKNNTNQNSNQGILFRQQLRQQTKSLKTNSSVNSKLNKMITIKTQKNEQKVQQTAEQKLKQLQKQLEILTAKIKLYDDNYLKCKLEMIEYKSRFRMNAVFKQIRQVGEQMQKGKGIATGNETSKIMTLKKAFQEHMKQNKIMQVVARCAYRWLWNVRNRKGKIGRAKVTN